MRANIVVKGDTPHNLNSGPFVTSFTTGAANPLMFLSGSAYWYSASEGGQTVPTPQELVLEALVDGRVCGSCAIGKIDGGVYAALVPVFIQLDLNAGNHQLELRYKQRYVPPKTNYGGQSYFCVTLFELP